MSVTAFEDVMMDHPWVEKHRLPVTRTLWPRNNFFVTVTVPSPEKEASQFYMVTTPTDEEAAIIASFLQYTIARQRYYDSFLSRMAEKELDVDPGFNTISIIKRKDGTWAYKRLTWTQGHSPFPGSDLSKNSVMELLDYIENNCMTNEPDEKWTAWKKEHNL